jgi:hypothetical protein
MHKYQLAIENYEFSGKDKSKSIMNIINHYKGEIDDASNSTIYFGFPNELKQLCANGSLHEIGVCCDLWIDGVRK